MPTVVTVLPSPDACASVVPSLHLQTLYCPHSICVYWPTFAVIPMRSILWAKHLEEAVELLLCELTAAPGMIEPQEDLLSSGRINGIGPKVMKRAAAKLGIVFERHVRPDMGGVRTYWRLPGKAA